MTLMDILVLLIIIVSIILGAIKGILKGTLSLLTFIGGIVSAVFLYQYAAVIISFFYKSEGASDFLGFVLVLVTILLVGFIFSYWLRSRFRRARLSWADHWVGAIFGFLRGWLACTVLYMALTAFPWGDNPVRNGTLTPFLIEGSRLLTYGASKDIRDRFYRGYESLKAGWGRKR